MTKIIDGTKVLTYTEWEQVAGVREMFGELKDCDMCDGEGTHFCDCGHEHDCESCNGSGKEEDLRTVYEEMLRYELQLLLCWKNGIPLSRFANINKPERPDHRPVKLFIHN